MSANIASLNWEQRIAVIEANKATDEQAAKVFGTTADEVKSKRTEVVAEEGFDTAPYAAHFSTKPESATDTTDTTEEPKTIKRRGRSGNRVKTAFSAVTATPEPLEDFAKKHNVSVNVLRQTKRFAPDMGIRVGKRDGVTCIWVEEQDEASEG